MSQFYNTYSLFYDYLSHLQFPITFDQWMALDESDRAAALYVNFHKEISLAWYKNRFSYVEEEEGVSTVLQYLVKNSEIIAKDPRKFSGAYIYRVCANCIYCLRNVKRNADAEKYNLYSEITDTNNDININLYDLVPYQDDPIEVVQAKEAIWDIISKMGPKAEKVANHLITGDSLRRTSKRSGEYAKDRLRDVQVDSKEYTTILASLREQLMPYVELFI